MSPNLFTALHVIEEKKTCLIFELNTSLLNTELLKLILTVTELKEFKYMESSKKKQWEGK